MKSLVKRIFNEDSGELKRLYKHVEAINELDHQFSIMSDDELQEYTTLLKEKVAAGTSVNDLKEEAFALVREAASRVLGLKHYDVQLIGGLVLLDGGIAQMRTGEGKTLVATLPSYLKALEGKGVHVVTANEYLARRDLEQMGQVFQFLGLSVGLNISQMKPDEKKTAYEADITYGTGTEFGFDYLRDNMVSAWDQKVQRPLHYAIVDEIDSILIDEARTPLIIAGKSDVATELFYITSEIVRDLEAGEHYEYFPETKEITLKEQGALLFEHAFDIENLYDVEHQPLYHNILQSLKAHYVMRKDVDYIVKEDDILLVDPFTGRIMDGRTFSDGLHQALEAKEGVSVKEENLTQATVTVQNYFRMYETLSGMTGSATPSKQEFYETYNLKVIVIPTNKPNARDDKETLVYVDYDSKVKRIIEEVSKIHQTGRPILIGTTSIKQSEKLSTYLNKANIKHTILNAKTEKDEADIISKAGQKGQVMLATNMAGRGTDIHLGKTVSELGGLHIIGTEMHESERIDMQLQGRAGRQGDPGSTQFIISLEDDIFHYYDRDLLEKWNKKMKTDENGLVTAPNPLKFAEKVQGMVEGSHFAARKHLLKLDDVVDQQRKIIYKKRDELLSQSQFNELIMESLHHQIGSLINQYCSDDIVIEEWPVQQLYEELVIIFEDLPFMAEDLRGLSKKEIEMRISELVQSVDQNLTVLADHQEFQQQMKHRILNIVDRLWIIHMDIMSQLKEGISIRGYGQADPYRLYEGDAYHEFEHLLAEVNNNMCKQINTYINFYLSKQDDELI